LTELGAVDVFQGIDVDHPGGEVEPEHDREFTVEARAQWKTIARRFFRHRLAVASTIVLLLIAAWAFFVPLFWKYGFAEINTKQKSLSPHGEHPFGTDDLGKDVFARVMRGTQRSLEIALIVSLLATTLGVTIGAIAGFYRGWVDALLMRFTDLVLVIPLLIIVGVVSSGIPSAPWYMIPVLLGLFGWPLMARITRGEFLSLREKEFVEAARAVGSPNRRIIFKHILPNVAGPIIVNATLTVAGAILTETALSFLGLGIREPEVSLGLLINKYQNAYATRPWLFWFPSVSIILICLCVNFIGDGLRDAFDPRQNRVKA
jgi:peptide/nickel transport system permease protein